MNPPGPPPDAVPPQPPAPWLAPFLTALVGRPIEVAGMSTLPGGETPRRPHLSPDRLLLPSDLDPSAAHGLPLDWARLVHAAGHLLHSAPGAPVAGLTPMSRLVISALEDARVDRLMIAALPGVRPWLLASLAPAPPETALGFEDFMGRLDHALLDPDLAVREYWTDKARRLFEAAATEHGLEDAAAFRALAGVLANDLGQMRVRGDAATFIVCAPYRDDHDFLWQPADPGTDAPQDAAALTTRSVDIRTTPGPGSAPPQDAPGAGESSASPSASAPSASTPDPATGPSPAPSDAVGLGRWLHPEWDARLERLRPDWCTLIVRRPDWQGREDRRHTVWAPGERAAARLRALLPSTLPLGPPTQRARRRLEDAGGQPDLDAVIRARVDRHQGGESDGRVFVREARDPPGRALLILLDLSASTSDPLPSLWLTADPHLRTAHGPINATVLDLEKHIALALAGRAREQGDRVAIHGFSSDTRHAVDYWQLLDFGAPFDDAARARLDSVQARHATRLGAALRHARLLMSAETCLQRDVLVISDGAPSDVDTARPDDLVEDARVAVIDARRAGIDVHGVILDPAADGYARRIFGRYGLRVLPPTGVIPEPAGGSGPGR